MTKHYLNTGGIVGVTLVVGVISDVLLREKIPLLSINMVQATMNHWATHWHVVAIGALPIYVGLILFSSVIMGLFLGSTLQRWLMRFVKAGINIGCVIKALVCKSNAITMLREYRQSDADD